MKTAIIMIDERRNESVEVKQYGDNMALYIDAPSAQDGARLLIENENSPADTVERFPEKAKPATDQKELRYKIIKMDVVREAARSFEQSEDGEAFLQRVKEAEAANGEGAGLNVLEARYLEARILQGDVIEALAMAYTLGTYKKH